MNIYAEIQKMASYIKAGEGSVAMSIAINIVQYCYDYTDSTFNYESDAALFESRSDVNVSEYLGDAADQILFNEDN